MAQLAETMAQRPGRDSAGLARTIDQAVKTVARMEGKYLTFALAEEEYGIGILTCLNYSVFSIAIISPHELSIHLG